MPGLKTWVFDRGALQFALNTAKPLTGSKIQPVCDGVRFSLIPNEDGTKADAYIYGTNTTSFICVRYGTIEAQGGTYTPGAQIHFLLDLAKLLKILRGSAMEQVQIRETRAAVYEEVDGAQQLKQNARYCIHTEAKNFLQSGDIYQFPHEDFAGTTLATYEPGVLTELWRKASVARGELDITRTCMHYNGDLVTLDQSFCCAVTTPLSLPKSYAINLEKGLTDVVAKMQGTITVSTNEGASKVYLLDENTGIFLVARLAVATAPPYDKALTGFEYPGAMVAPRLTLEAALRRADAFMDKKYSSAVVFQTAQVEGGWVLKITTPEDQSGQRFEEDVALTSCVEILDAAYSVINLIKAMDAYDGEEVTIKWRKGTMGTGLDNSLRLIDTQEGHVVNCLIPNMATARRA